MRPSSRAREAEPRPSGRCRVNAWTLAVVICVLGFAWAVAQFHQDGTGFTSLISIGEELNESTALRQVPHFTYDDSVGYDGAYYVQIALAPGLQDPELHDAIDNLPYRARRILFCWVAWLLGLGQPVWIVQAHALLNVLCWFALGGLLLRWLPPTSGQNFLRWFAVMFSHGVAMSVRHSLVDLPSLLLVTAAIGLVERGRALAGAGVLGLAGLGKETSLLAAPALADDNGHASRTWRRWLPRAAIAALPLIAWLGYLRMAFGPAEDPGFGNFGVPLAGLAEKWGSALAEVGVSGWRSVQGATVAVTVGLTVQGLFMALRWRPAERWWRIGAAYALLLALIATPVWEGLPGAATRVLLPLTLAFNLLVPRTTRWLPILLAGNLTVCATWWEFSPPYESFLRVRGPVDAITRVEVDADDGWHASESNSADRWRWTRAGAALRVRNASTAVLRMTLGGQVSALEQQSARITVGETVLWTGNIGPTRKDFSLEHPLPPGDTVIRFAGERPARPTAHDARPLALCVFNLEMVLAAPPVQP